MENFMNTSTRAQAFLHLLKPLFFILILSGPVSAQKLLDPSASGGPISVVVASSGGVNTSIAVAYSVRQLKATYDHTAITPPTAVNGFTNSTTPLMRVRRSSDDGQLDIGYLASGMLDTITLKSFVGGGNGFVVIWYDQSGNSRDAVQGNTTVQPRIVNSGTLERNQSSIPGMMTINGQNISDASSTNYGITGDRTLNVICQPKIYSNGGINGCCGTYALDRRPIAGDNPLTSIKISSDKWGLQIRTDAGGGLNSSFEGTTAVNANRTDNLTAIRSGDVYSLEVNGTLTGSTTVSGVNTMDPVKIGYGSIYTETVYYGEVVLFSSAISTANKYALYKNQNSFFNVGGAFTWTGATSTDWNTASNWSNNTVPAEGSSVTVPSGTTNALTITSLQTTLKIYKLTVNSGATVTINGNLNVTDSVNSNGTITGTGTLTLSGIYQQYIKGTFSGLINNNTADIVYASGGVSVNGTLTTSASTTLDMGTNTLYGTLNTITNNGTIKTTSTSNPALGNGMTWGGTGTVEFALTSGGQILPFGTFTNLKLSNTSGSNTVFTSSNISVTGTLTIAAGGTLNMVTGQITSVGTVANSGTIITTSGGAALPSGKTWGGTVAYIASSGTQAIAAGTYNNLTLGNTSGTQTASGTLTVNGTLTVPSATTFDMATYQLLAVGTISNSGTIKTANTTTLPLPTGKTWGGTVEYNATATQTVSNGTYNNLTMNSGAKNAGGDLVVNGTLMKDNMLLDMGTYLLSGTLTSISNNNAEIRTANTSANPLPSGRFWGTAGWVTYNAPTGGQTVVNGIYVHLNLQNTSGTQTASGGISIDQRFIIRSGSTLYMGTYLLEGAISSPEISGTLSTANTSSTPIPNSKTWGGTVNYNAITGGQTISNGTYNNLTISNSSNTNTAGGNITVNGTLTIAAGGILDMSTNTLGGTLSSATINGQLITSNTSATPLPSGKTWGGNGRVQYGVTSGGQTIVGGSYNLLTLSNTSGTNTASGNMDVYGELAVPLGGTFDLSTYQLTGNLATVTVVGTLKTQNTANPPLPNGKTWGGTVEYNSSSNQTISGGTYNNLTLGNATKSANGNLVVNGTLTVNNWLDMGTYALSGTLATITNNGGISTANTSANPLPSGRFWGSGSWVTYNAATGGQTVVNGIYTHLNLDNTSGTQTANGDLTVNQRFIIRSGGTLNMGTNILNGLITSPEVSGTLITANTSATPIPTGKIWGGTINYNATTGGQTINATRYNNLTLSNTSGNQTSATNLVVNGILTTTTGGTLDMGTNTLTGTLGTITNNGTIKISNTTSTPIVSGKTWGGTGTVQYAVTTGAQTIVNGTYNNLTLSNTSGTNTAGGNIGLTGILTVPSGGTLNMSTFQMSGSSSTINNNGTVNTACTASPPLPSGKTWGGTVQYAVTTGGQTIAGGNYNNLIFQNTSGTNTAEGAISVAGAFTVPTSTTIDMSSFALSGTFSGTMAVTGTIKTACTTGAIPGFIDWSSGGNSATVEYYNPTGGQQVTNGIYKNLVLSNTSGTQTATGGNILVNGSLTIASGSTFDMNTRSLSGTLTGIINNGTLKTRWTSTNPIPSGKTWGGTVEYYATTGSQQVANGTYNNLTLSNTSGTSTAIGNLTVNGTLTTSAGGTMDMGTNIISGTLSTITNNGTFKTSNTSSTPVPNFKTWGGSGPVQYAATTGGQTIIRGIYNNLQVLNTSGANTASGDLTVNNSFSSTAGGTLDMGTSALYNPATVDHNGILLTANTTLNALPNNKTWNGTVTYNATAGGQTIFPGTYNNLTLNNSSNTNTATGTVTVNGALTTTAGGTFLLNSNQLAGNPTSVNSNGITRTGHTATSTPIPAGKTWGGTVEYFTASGFQTVVDGTYNNLTVSNTSGTSSAGGNLTVNGALNTSAGGTFNLGTNTISGSLTSITNNGTITTSNTSATPLPSGKTWGGTGTVNYAANSGGQTIVEGTYNSLTSSNTSATSNTASGNLIVNETLTTASGGILHLNTFTLGGTLNTINNSGIIRTGNTSATPIPSGKTWGGTVQYTVLSGGQTIVSGTYNNLSSSNTSNTNTAGGNLTVNGLLVTAPGSIVDMGTNTLSGTLSTISINGILKTSNTSATPIPEGKTWTGTIEYSSASAQTIVSANSYATLKISGGSTKILAAPTTVNTDLNLSAGDLSIAANTLTIGGTVSGPGTLTGSASSNMVINGSAANAGLNFNQTSASTRSLNNITLSRSNGATLNNALEVIGTVDVTAGTLASGGNLTLISTNSNTARIAALSGGASVSGNVNAQRFILGGAGRRKYRYLSSPVNVSGSYNLNQFIDDVTITGTGAGYDGLTVTPSAFVYDETMAGVQNTGFVAPATTSTPIAIGQGVAIFYRGPRGQPGEFVSSTVPNDATFDVFGTINAGDITPTLSYTDHGTPLEDGWNLVGNPYPSQIDWNAAGWTKTNISNVISLYNPATGTYGTYNGTIGTNGATRYIAQGQGFFVQATAASPVLTFRESIKVANTPSNMFRTDEDEPQLVRLVMYKDENNSDEAIVLLGEQASPNYNGNEDALKFMNSTINIYSKSKDLYNLVINSTSFPLVSDTIDVVISGAVGAYQLRVSEIASLDQNINVFVVDHFTNQIIALTSNEMVIPFNITSNPASTGANRFDIVFSKTSAPLPIKLITFTANPTDEKTIQLNWSASEINMDHYVIEKMNKKGTFEPIASLNARNSSSLNFYSYMDIQLDPGVNTYYYRLKMIDRDETSEFSNVIAVVFKNEQTPINVFPNPSNGLIHIHFDNSDESNSQIDIINIFNQTMMTVDVNETGKITKTLDLSVLSKGVYFVKVSSDQSTQTVKINLQ
jgi:hypothetical protein